MAFTSSPCKAAEFDLLDVSTAERNTVHCELQLKDEVALVTNAEEGKDTLVDLVLSPGSLERVSPAPTVLELEIKTELPVGDEEYIVYWCTTDDRNWRQFERIPIVPDGTWHKYRVPLTADQQLLGVRLSFGKNPHEIHLRNARITQLKRLLPEPQSEQRNSLPSQASIQAGQLTVEFDCQASTFLITDSRTGRDWHSDPLSQWFSLTQVTATSDNELLISLYDHFVGKSVDAVVTVDPSNKVSFLIRPQAAEDVMAGARCFPPRFQTNMELGHFVFCDRSCGVLLDQRDKKYADWPLRVYGSTHCLDMPWVGMFDMNRGDGMMLLFETPADAELAFVKNGDGLLWPQPRWLSSMDTFGYPRKVSMSFTADGNYVSLANLYRDHLKQTGRFKTLKEKAELKPNVERLKGAASLWGARFPTRFIREMRPLGVTSGIVNPCKEPGIVRWLNEQGYLTGCYDSYTDIRQGPTGFQSDDVNSTAIRERPGGPPKRGWTLGSGEHLYWRSSARWDQAATSYVDRDLQRRPYNSRFVDVAAAATLFEDYHPDHTMDRRQDLKNRRALFSRLNDYGLVLGTEHGNDWVADQVEYFEGAMSGPFWWSSWPAGYLKRPTREQLSADYLKYGMGFENRVPLWELVYHDSAISTWYWGDTAGLLYQAAPELSDRKDLFNLLYGTTPLLWINNTGYQLPDEIHRFLRTYHDTCQWHRNVAFAAMTSHEFLSEDRTLQRTRFANGCEVVVNFSDTPREYGSGEQAVTLAPQGYMAQGPNYRQTRLWVNNAPQLTLKQSGFLIVDASANNFVAGVKSTGRLTTFKTGDDSWNVFVDPDGEYELDIPAVTGWNNADSLAIHYMDDIGEIRKIMKPADENGVVRFSSTKNVWRFTLVREPKDSTVTAVGSNAGDTDPSS